MAEYVSPGIAAATLNELIDVVDKHERPADYARLLNKILGVESSPVFEQFDARSESWTYFWHAESISGSSCIRVGRFISL